MTEDTIIHEKLRVTVLAGARSTEHEVSLLSAYNIVNAIDRNKYTVSVVGIDKQGVWRQYDPDHFVEEPTDITKIKLAEPISGRLAVTQSSNTLYDIENGGRPAVECDVIFPAVLGNYAEDGTMQGMLRMMDVPFTTPDVLGSAVAMDKDIAGRLLRDAGIRTANFVTLRNGEAPSYDTLTQQLETDTMFVKPVNAGSSVGVSKVRNESELQAALTLAYRYDTKVMVQSAVVGREVEISVMGTFDKGQRASAVIGEIIEQQPDDFYSYDNKYVSSDNVILAIPAELDDVVTQEIREVALEACKVLECEGFSRVDFFVDESNTVYVNEINTMPGFTNISMFPRLWIESGIDYSQLIDSLLQTALHRHEYRIRPLITDAKDVTVSAEVS